MNSLPEWPVRQATSGDIAALERIEAVAFAGVEYDGMRLSRRSFVRHARDKRNAFFVAVQPTADGDIVCGYALGFVRRDSPYVRFVSLAIRPEDAGKGVGKVLFKSIEAYAREHGHRGVRLEIRDDNLRLFERYSRIGYKVFERVPGYYSDGHAAVRMVKDFSWTPSGAT